MSSSHLELDPDRFSGRAGTKFGWREETVATGDEDPSTKGWARRPEDPNVQARLEHLRANNGLKGLEIVSPHEIERATALFLRDGFVAVRDVLMPEQLEIMQQATAEVNAQLVAANPGLLRYSYNSHSNLHKKAWVDLVDLPTTTPILESIFHSKNYWVWGAGGDFSLPGTFEYQRLHRDLGPGDFHDPSGKLQIWDLPPFSVTLNFPMVDFDNDVGPIRQIPGTQSTRASPPLVADEPEWMKLSTVLGLKAGGVIFRDLRAWHGGTPNLSDKIRAMPNVEYHAPWFMDTGRCKKTMPFERYCELSEHGKHVCRFIYHEKDVSKL